jgi:LPPG:FO 2-phospho-L-lactate transferase
MFRIAALAGGIGGARFLRGLRAAYPDSEITAIVNTGDDITLFGLRICPDLDTVMYTLGDGIHEEQGWGRRNESFTLKEELAAYGAEPQWFGLGDRDLATHIIRTQMLDSGYRLSAITNALCDRWKPGVTLLPMSDERVETHVEVERDGTVELIHFQEWWIRHRAGLAARRILPINAENAKPAPGVIEAIASADIVIFPPSNPVVSIGTILAVPGIREAIRGTSAPVVGVSPIIAGAPVRGMADACLTAIGVETSAEGVAAHYGARSEGGLLDAWVVDTDDACHVAGIRTLHRPILMSDMESTTEMARASVEFAHVATA